MLRDDELQGAPRPRFVIHSFHHSEQNHPLLALVGFLYIVISVVFVVVVVANNGESSVRVIDIICIRRPLIILTAHHPFSFSFPFSFLFSLVSSFFSHI